MSNSGDRLHLYRIHFLERVIENARGIDGLEAKVFIVEVADEEGFGREGIRLDIHVCSCHTP